FRFVCYIQPAPQSSDCFLSPLHPHLQGELRFEDDHLVEGGVLGSLHNGTRYRRGAPVSYRPPPCPLLLLTRVYSEYVESILEDFQAGPKPDVLVLNSCVWDVSRYGPSSMKAYRKNLETVFNRLDAVLPASCLVIWNMTMPLGPRVTGGFLIPEHLSKTLRNDIIEGNFYGATLAGFHLFDVLDLHFHFRFDLRNRVKDGVHWNNVVHRRITNLLLTHVADAWRVVVPSRRRSPDGEWAGSQLASGSFHCREGRLARSPGFPQNPFTESKDKDFRNISLVSLSWASSVVQTLGNANKYNIVISHIFTAKII
uniref:Family with sequence similarity 113 n=1 Tax=Podarcis muralis TaxID=64176 RepID=A0A670IUR8_PODMU